MIRVIVLILWLGLTFSVDAQEKSKWSGTAGIGGSYFRGNVNKMDIRSDGSVSHADSVFEYSFFYRISYGESNFIKNNHEFSLGTKFDWRPKDIFTPFFALTGYKNEFTGYLIRLSVLGGVKYTIIDQAASDYSLSMAVQYDAERYTPPLKIDEVQKPNKENIRLSVRPKIKQKINDTISLEHISFIRPIISDFSNIQAESQTILSNKLTESVSLNIVHEFTYDSKPPSSTILNANNSMIVSLRVRF